MRYDAKESKQPDKLNKVLVLADEFAATNNNFISSNEEDIFYMWENDVWKYTNPKTFERWMIGAHEPFQYLSRNGRKEAMHGLSLIKQVTLAQMNSCEILDLENGVYCMKKNRLLPHDRKYLSTIRIPYKYEPKAQCPLWIAFMNSSLEGNAERISALQEFMGYCLGRDNHFHRALILLGEGRNGKGTTFHIIRKLVGAENGTSLTLSQMTDKNMAARLANKLINIDADTDSSARNYEANFRLITGGDPIMVKNLYENPFELKPYVKLIIGANELPHIADKTHGFYDRLIIIPYNVSFAGREDFALKDKLEAEISGILNWALIGRKRLYERGKFTDTDEMKQLIQELKTQNNPLESYVSDHIRFHDDAVTTKKVVYAHYREWCKDNSYHPLSQIKFSREFYRICKPNTQKDTKAAYGNREHIWPNVFIIGVNEPVKQQAWTE